MVFLVLAAGPAEAPAVPASVLYGLEVTAVLRSFERIPCQWALEMSHFGCPAGSGAARLEPEGPHEDAFPAGGLGLGSRPERMDRLGELGVAPHHALPRYARGPYVTAVPVGQSSFIIESPSRPWRTSPPTT